MKTDNIFNTLRFRLTLWFSLLFSVIFLLLFLILQRVLSEYLMDQTDQELSNKVKRYIWLGYGEELSPEKKDALIKEFVFQTSQEGNKNVFYLYLDQKKNIIASSSPEYWQGLIPDSTSLPYLPDKPDKDQIRSLKKNEKNISVVPLNHNFRSHTIIQTLDYTGRDDKIRVAFQYFNNNTLFITGISLHENSIFLKLIRKIFLISFSVLLAVVIILSNLLTRKSLAGVEEIKNTAIRIGKHDIKSRVVIPDNIVELKSLADAFNNMLERIGHLMDEQKEMTHNLAHDLRSPVTGIRGITETTISSNPSIEEYELMAGKIINMCDRLIHLINSMLDISDIESGNFKTLTENLDLKQILEACHEVYQPVAEDKNVQLHLSQIEKSVYVHGNKALLQRAIGNIVDNAIKYTNEGGLVEISYEAEHDFVKVVIRDSGTGIPPEEINHIFERFYRGDKSRSAEGNGLGLSLAKAYIGYHNGSVEVQSETDKGSVFTIRLPSLRKIA